MQPQLAQAQPQVNSVYDPAQSQIQLQVPAIQQLYGALLQGLTAQSQNQASLVSQSAAQRGVGSQGITQGAQDALGSSLALQAGQLGASQAQDVAGLKGQIGKLNVGRASAQQDLASALFRQDLESQSHRQKLTEIERNAQLQQTQNQQDFNIKAAQYQAAQARAAQKAAQDAANFDLTTVSKDQLVRQLKVSLNAVRGKDGHVSPESLAKAYNTWAAAGLDAPSFWKNYQGLWNSKQKTYNDQFHYFVSKGV